MASNPRPAKRPRRSITVLSDDEDEIKHNGVPPSRSLRSSRLSSTQLSGRPSSVSSSPRSKRACTATNVVQQRVQNTKTHSPKSSPEKSRKSKTLSIDNSKNKSLHTFFSKVNDEDRWHQRSATPDVDSRPESSDDIVDDDSVDDILVELSRKPALPTRSIYVATQSKQPPSSSQRFRIPPVPKSTGVPSSPKITQKQEDVRPWAELYAPCSLDELSIHKKKSQDVQGWLTGALSGKSKQKILVLKGPAGSGKSTTIDLLSRAHKFDLVHWRNPDTSESGALSSSLQFAEFISRGGDYGALSLNTDGERKDASSNKHRVLLVEDFPATLTWNSVAMESFRSALLQAAAGNDSTDMFGKWSDASSRPPIILVISETLVSTSTSFTDSFTAQRLLGPELINHHGLSVIEFNPVAPTFLSKALDLVIKKEARDSGRRRIPGSVILQKLADMGDIRNAVNSLQLLCTRGDDTGDWSGTVAARANPKRASKVGQPLSKAEEGSLKLISSRETTLDMFHAAAKVCYNKRDDSKAGDTRVQPPPKPPDHLMHQHKPGASQVDIEDLLNETGTDMQTFISTVHQNYVLSCNHDDFADYLDGCASFLSDSELLDPDSRMSGRSRARAGARRNAFQLGTFDSLRQDEMSFNVATRGVLFSLPYPVSRATLPDARKMDAFKMFYPASLRIWKPTEETNDLIDLTIARLLGQQSDEPRNTGDSGVSSWRTRQSAFTSQPSSATTSDTHESAAPRLYLHKETLILDTLPYMTTIKSHRGENTTLLRKITQMRGVDISTEDDAEDDVISKPMSATARLTQRVEAVHESIQNRQRKQQVGATSVKVEGITNDEDPPIEKLWIEDDDIEDVDD